MGNYILYNNGYATTFYRNIDENIAKNIEKGLVEGQQLKKTDQERLPQNELPPLREEDVLNSLRAQREAECFSVINRGKLWYDGLTEEQLGELKAWYQAWLDAPQTKEKPKELAWLK